jgi:geranylgeranyl pyrophosphate synthase
MLDDQMRSRADRVFDFLDELIASLPSPEAHHALLRVHLEVGRRQLHEIPSLACAQLPLLVYAANRGEETPAIPLAGACTLIYLGADLFDNIVDEELPFAWQGYDAGQITLAAATLIAALPTQAISRLQMGHCDQVDTSVLWRLTELFSLTLLAMSAGQREDLTAIPGQLLSPTSSRLVSERKSGAEISLFARAGAVLAGATAQVEANYAEFGSCLGTAMQIGSDLTDIWDSAESQDLFNGKCTLPIAYALEKADQLTRDYLCELLEESRHTGACHSQVRELLSSTGALRYTAVALEYYRQRARRHLQAAQPQEPARSQLHNLVDSLSIFVPDAS